MFKLITYNFPPFVKHVLAKVVLLNERLKNVSFGTYMYAGNGEMLDLFVFSFFQLIASCDTWGKKTMLVFTWGLGVHRCKGSTDICYYSFFEPFP